MRMNRGGAGETKADHTSVRVTVQDGALCVRVDGCLERAHVERCKAHDTLSESPPNADAGNDRTDSSQRTVRLLRVQSVA